MPKFAVAYTWTELPTKVNLVKQNGKIVAKVIQETGNSVSVDSINLELDFIDAINEDEAVRQLLKRNLSIIQVTAKQVPL